MAAFSADALWSAVKERGPMTTPRKTVERSDRIRSLLRQLSRTRNVDTEAALISRLSIETEALRRERSHGAGITISFSAAGEVTAAPWVRARSRRS
jgi:hypothetical protein